MRQLGTWASSGLDSAGETVKLNELRELSQPKKICDYVIQ